MSSSKHRHKKFEFDQNHVVRKVDDVDLNEIKSSGGPQHILKREESKAKTQTQQHLAQTPSPRLKRTSTSDDVRREKNLRSNKIADSGKSAREKAMEHVNASADVGIRSLEIVRDDIDRRMHEASTKIQTLKEWKSK